MKSAFFGFALFCLPGLFSHAEEKDPPKPSELTPGQRYAVPEKTDDGWETAALQSVGFETALMEELLQRIWNGTYKNTHSVLVVKNGKLVFEQYFPGEDSEGRHRDFDREMLHTQQSATKSVNSILVGIAIDRHLIAGVEEKISTFFPEDPDLFSDSRKAALRLKDCLAMTAGLAWVENGTPYTDPRNDAYGLNRSNPPGSRRLTAVTDINGGFTLSGCATGQSRRLPPRGAVANSFSSFRTWS